MTIKILLLCVFILLIASARPAFARSSAESIISTPNPPQEEKAINNLDQGLLPEGIEPPRSSGSIFDNLKTLISNIFNPQRFFAQSQSLRQSTVPREIKTEQNEDFDPRKAIQTILGGSSGFYGVTIPNLSGSATTGFKASEKDYENSYFPPGVKPITED